MNYPVFSIYLHVGTYLLTMFRDIADIATDRVLAIREKRQVVALPVLAGVGCVSVPRDSKE
jgi:hypothetical protein